MLCVSVLRLHYSWLSAAGCRWHGRRSGARHCTKHSSMHCLLHCINWERHDQSYAALFNVLINVWYHRESTGAGVQLTAPSSPPTPGNQWRSAADFGTASQPVRTAQAPTNTHPARNDKFFTPQTLAVGQKPIHEWNNIFLMSWFNY